MGIERKILAGWLIDGSGEQVRKDVLICFKDGYIKSIETSKDPNAYKSYGLNPKPKNYSNATVIPCLIDSHVHLAMSGSVDPKIRQFQLKADDNDIRGEISNRIRNHLLHGIIAVRDGGDKKGHVLRYKRDCFIKNTDSFNLQTPGSAIYRKGRYGSLIGKPVSEKRNLAEEVTAHEKSIDHVKIINSGLNSLRDYGKRTLPQFSEYELTEAVKAAKRFGLKTMAHANGETPVKIAVDSGCHSVEHGFFMGYENLQKMAEKKIYWVPTAITMKAYSESCQNIKTESEIAKKNFDHQLEQITMAKDLGVPVALGSDAGSPGVDHGKALIEEMKIMVSSGYSIEEAIRCATFNNADLLGLKEIGLLEKGKQASFIIANGNPSDLPGSLQNIEKVYIKGKPMND